VTPTAPIPGMSANPMSYLHTYSPGADPVTRLGWGLGIISIAVVVIISGLLLAAILRRREPANAGNSDPLHIGREGRGMRWIYIGVGLSTVVLFGLAVWTLMTIAAVSRPPAAAAFTVRVTGYQWWWRVRYEDRDASRTFTTANEIHIPVGKPVRLELESADVIHSFWVPQLGGKTDTIPGQTNVSWIQADRPGVYRGQCGEYCGMQHAHMAMLVVADPPEVFASWWNAQLQPAAAADALPAAAPPALSGGQTVFVTYCGACHAVRGTDAGGIYGPDLTHLMGRHMIAAGTIPNDAAHLADWIRHAQQIKPGTGMPDIALSDRDLKAVTAFLQTLQ
jgi:cytochrome c oxidase subunit 2